MIQETTFVEFDIEHMPYLLSMMQDFYAIDNYLFDNELAQKNLTLFLQGNQSGRIWLILENGVIAGYIVICFCFSFEFGGRTAFLDELFLKEEHRGKGLGNKALDFVLSKAKEMQLQAVHLEVEEHNKKGKSLYSNKGFVKHSRFLMTKFINKDSR